MKNILFLVLAFFLTACNNAPDAATKNAPKTVEKAAINQKNIVFFGNSLTAAYGLDDVSKGFVGLIQSRVDSLNLAFRCINAGLSGETTAGGNDRVEWVISQQPVDIFVLELGGNDALRGISPESSIKNLQSIVNKVKAKYPSVKIVLSGMEAPRNMGGQYIKDFHNMYPTLAKTNNLSLIPFVLEGVGGIPELNQKDGIHPTEKGNVIIVENIWKVLKGIL